MASRRLPRTVAVAFVAASAALVAQSVPKTVGRALTIEDYYRVLTVGNPQFTPDGQSIVFTVSTRVEETNGTRAARYIVPVDGSSPERLLTADTETPPGRGGGGGGGRGGGTGSATPTASPDGAWMAAVRDNAVPDAPVTYASDFEKRHQERFKGAIIDWKDFQRDGGPFPAPDPHARPAARLVLVPSAGGAEKVLVDTPLRPASVVWHPNGQLLAFVADPDWRDELKYESPDIYTVTTDGTLTRVTNDGYVYGDLDYSPDGKYLAYARTFGTDMVIQQKLNHGGPKDLFVRPVGGGDPINLTAKWDLEPGNSTWSPDGKFLYFSAEAGGENHFFRVSVPAGNVEQLTRGERRLNGVVFDKSVTKIAYTVGLHDSPAEIYVANVDGTNERKLTNVHRPFLSEVSFGRTERLRWPSKDGTVIEGWLTFPYGFDAARGPYPLIVFSHGGPHAATGYSFDFKKQYFAANGYFVLDTNFRGSTGYGEAFKWATWGAWGDKDGQDVIAGIDYALKRYPIDGKRVGHTGHSYGGFMTDWLITQYPDQFAAAIAGAGISDWMSDYGTADIYRTKETEFFGPPWDPAARERMIRQSPLTYADRVKTPTMFVGGEVDQRVPIDQSEEMYFALKRRGVPAKMIRYADQPHGIAGSWNNVHRMLNELAWWEKYLKDPAPKTKTPR